MANEAKAPLTNEEILQTYNVLISKGTQDTIAQALKDGDYGLNTVPIQVMNDFIENLTNKLFEQRLYDPLQFDLIYEPFIERTDMKHGEIIEHLGSNIPDSMPFTGESLLGKTYKPTVYVTRTYKKDSDIIPISYSYERIKEAFLDETGLYDLIKEIIGKIEARVDIDLYNRITPDLEASITKEKVMSSKGETDASAKDFMRELIDFVDTLKFPSTQWNEVGNTATLKKGILYLNTGTKANLDVNFYVTAFNSNKTELSKYFSEVRTINNIQDPNTIGFILDPNAYVCKFVLNYSEPWKDPSNMTTTFFKHVRINRGLTGQATAIKLKVAPAA